MTTRIRILAVLVFAVALWAGIVGSIQRKAFKPVNVKLATNEWVTFSAYDGGKLLVGGDWKQITNQGGILFSRVDGTNTYLIRVNTNPPFSFHCAILLDRVLVLTNRNYFTNE